MKNAPDTGQIHLGFRAVMTGAAWREKLKRQEAKEKKP